MTVPSKALDKPQPMLVGTPVSQVALESRSDIVRVRKVEGLSHIHLTEYRAQPLFLEEIVDFVIERNWEDVRALQAS